MIKKIFFGLSIFAALVSCENSEQEFDDFDYQTVYFPIQYPARTLALGESRSDNSIDLEHAFSIGVAAGGMYENTKDRVVEIELVPELAEGISTTSGNPIQMLPSSYYEDVTFDQITIPAGSLNGTIRVNLTDAFFQDPLATDVNYVLPLMIKESTKDSVLSGLAYSEFMGMEDVRKPEHWQPGASPKNYTLFAVKYINSKHGMYFLRGTNYELDAQDGNVVAETSYSQRYVTDDLQEMLTTVSLTENTLSRVGGQTAGNLMMNLEFDDTNKTVTVSQTEEGVSVPVTGSGTFLEANDQGAEVWGEKGHRTIFLDYEYELDGKFYQAKDTLVYRDNNLTYEEFSITFNE